MKEPLQKGTSWSLPDGRKRSITVVGMDAETPLATYSAIEVTTKYGNETTRDYYAKDIGLVKSEFISGFIFLYKVLLKTSQIDAKNA